jgi:phenylalanyl-tRNA synthetase alpha chain
VETSIEQIREQALSQLKSASNPDEIKALSVQYLGRKGVITQFLRDIAKLPPKDRPGAGKRANEVKKELDASFKELIKNIESQASAAKGRIDVSLPGKAVPQGFLHPLTLVTREICDIFVKLGFDIAEGPEVETDYYNFEALNLPKNHPARDMQDTFYVSDNIVLRTQTSPMQIRVMEKQAPPVRIIAPG